ncbi:haloacid dehalogenase- type II [Apiospora phragmitis]|uniref:Haloacid dehalogenase- type II n=1 Tax=Apiospora phragmitis TaxID=2905665 RepID=A0ABR1X6F9_9PEZI
MDGIKAPKAIAFDLDNTLFDHYHSLRCAITAIRSRFPELASRTPDELITKYNAALQSVYDTYLGEEITYEQADLKKVQTFFTDLGLAEPSLEQVKGFRAVYKPAYREARSATPGSVETLSRLRANGYSLAILTNGQTEDQTAKAEAIGVRHLVHHLITSEEVGHTKPDPRIFDYVLDRLGTNPGSTYMVGDSPSSDIKGALDVGMRPVLYSPLAQVSERVLFEQKAPVVHHMSQLLGLLGITDPQFEPRFQSDSDNLTIEGLGFDLITEPRHCLRISKDTARFIATNIGKTLVAASDKRHIVSMTFSSEIIRTVAKSAAPIDEGKIHITFSGKHDTESVTPALYQIEEREHSVLVRYQQLSLNIEPGCGDILRRVATLLQAHFNDLMRDYPRAAVRNLRCAMLVLAGMGGVEMDTVVTGEGIDE